MDIYDPHHSLLLPVLLHYGQCCCHVPKQQMGTRSSGLHGDLAAWSHQHSRHLQHILQIVGSLSIPHLDLTGELSLRTFLCLLSPTHQVGKPRQRAK